MDAILAEITDDELLQFVKEYMRSHPAMANAFVESRKRKLSEAKHSAPFDYKKEVAGCYTHVMKRVRWEKDWSRLTAMGGHKGRSDRCTQVNNIGK